MLTLALGPEYRSIDEAAILPLQALFEHDLGQSVPRAVVLDLSHVTRACSSFLGLLAVWWKDLRTRGPVRLAVCGASPPVRERLVITGLTTLWPLFATREAALAAVESETGRG